MMSCRSILTSLALALVLTSAVRGQQPHVQARYAKEADVTIVDSDLFYVINMPSQFMIMRFEGAYSRQGKPTQLPRRINLQFSSYSLKALYQPDNSHRLKVKLDDQILDFGLLAYSKLDENYRTKEGEQKTNPRIRPTLPSAALIGTTGKDVGLTEEIMWTNLALADLTKLAQASTVLTKIGDTVFPLTAMHMTILREFATAITPSNLDSIAPANINEPPLTPDVPSDANRAPLDETLKWLKTEIDREGSTKDIVIARKLEPLEFKDCRIKYRLVPLVRTSQVAPTIVNAIMVYQLNLGDLNPETVTSAKLGDYAIVFAATRDVQPKIKVFKHANDDGSTGRTLEESESAKLAINMKSLEAAAHLKAALIHAINLCHAQRQ
jgi:hypothetical protein